METSFVRNGNVLWAESGPGQIMMMSGTTDRYYAVTDVAARVWELLEVPRTLDALCADIRREFEVDASECRQALAAFVGDLVRDGLAHPAA